MVASTTRKIFSLAISLLVVVISLTDVALGATTPNVTTTPSLRYTPGFSGAPGKMARDAAGNFYVTDFWGKQIRKFDRNGLNPSSIATNGRPSAVAVLPDNRLVVAIQVPQPYIAFYSQQTGLEISRFDEVPATYPALYRPSGITVDNTGKIYVVDAGDSSGDESSAPTGNCGRVRVYNSAGTCIHVFGTRTNTDASAPDTATTAFKQPLGIAYEKTGGGGVNDGHIVVVDTLNCRLMFYKQFDGSSCVFVKKIGTYVQGAKFKPVVGNAVRFQDPVDVAFEYAGTAVERIYVAERGRNEIAVVDPAPTPVAYKLLKQINSVTVTNADMKLPSAVLFEKTATGGVLYTDNATTSTPANVMAFLIDLGTVPLPPVATLAINPVPATRSIGNYTLSGTVAPLSAVSCTVNGVVDIPMSSASNWSNPVPIVAGNNYILCKTTHIASGTTTFAEARTYGGTATAAPTVTILQPGANVLTKAATVAVSGTSNTAGANVTITNAGYTFNTTTDAAKNWSALVPLAEGSNVINVTASILGSNVGTASVTVTADNTAPAIAVSFLADGSTTVKAVQNIDGIVTDANLGSTSQSIITVNGVAVPASAKVLNATNTYFSVPVTLARGQNTVTVSATDLLGNTPSAPVSRTVTYNPDVTGLIVSTPAVDNSYLLAAGTVGASGTVGPGFTTVHAGDKTITGVVTNWTTPDMTVAGGFGEYLFTATDGVTTFSEKRTIIAGAPYIQLAITAPATDITTSTASVPIAGSVATCSPFPQISVDGGTAVNVTTCNPGNFSHTLTLLSQGTHVVKVTKGATSTVRNIIFDTTLPAISIQSNAHDTPSNIVGSIEPSAKITAIDAKLNGASYSIPLSVLSYTLPYVPASGSVVWSANLTAYPYDKDSLKFTAVDPALNQKQITYAKGVPTGDVNHDEMVTIDDAILCLRQIVGTTTLPSDDKFQCDVGLLVDGHAAQDGNVDISDAVLILGKAAGVVTF